MLFIYFIRDLTQVHIKKFNFVEFFFNTLHVTIYVKHISQNIYKKKINGDFKFWGEFFHHGRCFNTMHK